ncbi:hypothetical protein KQR57_05455 [Bacillus inaquosorum]|nr:hypothetical protein [Bacillus inaquosorum]
MARGRNWGPIEFHALNRSFRSYTDQKGYCALGSIKTNIGHTQLAAGISGLIKILLSLSHKQIPPSLHFEKENANIQLKDSPFCEYRTKRVGGQTGD